MRMFVLIRDVDVTGISGTGVVAEGIEFGDGTVALRWLDSGVSDVNRERGVRPTTVMHESLKSVEALHGHNGATHMEVVAWRQAGVDFSEDTLRRVYWALGRAGLADVQITNAVTEMQNAGILFRERVEADVAPQMDPGGEAWRAPDRKPL